LAVHY